MMCAKFSYLILILLNVFAIVYGQNETTKSSQNIVDLSSILYSPILTLFFDPPSGYFAPTALGVYVSCSIPEAKIYYSMDNLGAGNMHPTLNSKYATLSSPYIQLDTPFGQPRMRNLTIIAVAQLGLTFSRSEEIHLFYYVEAAARKGDPSLGLPGAYGWLVPSIESRGYFVGFEIEVKAVARAQIVGGQEFSDFFSHFGFGTYRGQVVSLKLTEIPPYDLQGFEGGIAVNTTSGKFYGVLVPYHNGNNFFGKVVRVDLLALIANATSCLEDYRIEYFQNGVKAYEGTNATDPCITVLDLSTVHPNARGFRRGFMNYPYAYLSPGEYNVAARLNMDEFTIETVNVVDMGIANPSYGGYSGGFSDGTWACFTPFKTYTGPVGGLRSTLPVDRDHLTAYYHSDMVCIDTPAWTATTTQETSDAIVDLDFSNMEPDLRGFSDCVRVGRYVYFSPLQSDTKIYTSKLIRLFLGNIDIGTAIRNVKASGKSIGTLINVLDLSQKDKRLFGFSSIFNAGKYIMLSPSRNMHEPKNGMRGHGVFARVDMNSFNLAGVSVLDMTATIRNSQTPSFNDLNLRGFSGGFSSGSYAILSPFYNGVFTGKVARLQFNTSLDQDLQELDLDYDRHHLNTFRGYTGGFASLWQAVQY